MTTPVFGQAPAAAPAAAPAFGQAPAAAQPQQGGLTNPPAAAAGNPFKVASEAPAAGDNFNAKELVGAVLLITPKGTQEVDTKDYGTKEVVVADIAVIGASNASGSWQQCPPEQSTVLHDSYIFGGRLIGRLKGSIGVSPVLGVLITEDSGKSQPAYNLADPNQQQYDAAMAFWDANKPAPPF